MLTTPQTDIEIAHPSVVFYDYYAAWKTPIDADKNVYLGETARVGTVEARGMLTLRQPTEPDPLLRLPLTLAPS